MILYEEMLQRVRAKMSMIEQVSLENDSYNAEWKELSVMEDSLLKLIKIRMEREL